MIVTLLVYSSYQVKTGDFEASSLILSLARDKSLYEDTRPRKIAGDECG